MKSPELHPNPDCAVCIHPQRAIAASMFELGANSEEIGAALQVAVNDVENHFAECLAQSSTDPHSASDGELHRMLRHATELYYASTLQGNLAAASSSLAVRLRVLSEFEARKHEREQRESLLDGADPHDETTWPAPLHKFLMDYFDGLLVRVEEFESRKVS